MLKDEMTLEHFTPEEVENARNMMLTLLRNGDAIGSWTDKTEVRQNGCSMHIKYENSATVRLDGKGTSNEFVRIMQNSPDLLYLLLVKLFAVGDDDMDALLEEAKAAAL